MPYNSAIEHLQFNIFWYIHKGLPPSSLFIFKNIYWSIVDLQCCMCAQSCPTLCDPMDCSPPGSSVHRILQARILEWVARALLQGIYLSWGLNLCLLRWQAGSLLLAPPGNPTKLCEGEGEVAQSCPTLCDPVDCSLPGFYQASPSMGFSRQEYWSGLPFPSPGDLPNPPLFNFRTFSFFPVVLALQLVRFSFLGQELNPGSSNHWTTRKFPILEHFHHPSKKPHTP